MAECARSYVIGIVRYCPLGDLMPQVRCTQPRDRVSRELQSLSLGKIQVDSIIVDNCMQAPSWQRLAVVLVARLRQGCGFHGRLARMALRPPEVAPTAVWHCTPAVCQRRRDRLALRSPAALPPPRPVSAGPASLAAAHRPLLRCSAASQPRRPAPRRLPWRRLCDCVRVYCV